MSRKHLVREGECLARIAADSGLPIDTIWLDPANASLRTRRPSPYLLAPGDVVIIPDPATRIEGGSTAKRTTFVRLGIPEVVRVRLQDEQGKPLRGVANFSTGSHNGCAPVQDGNVEFPIHPSDRAATITIETETGIETFQLELGFLRPATGANMITKVRAAQARLANLGYDCGPIDGKLGTETRAMLRAFQQDHGIKPPNGRLTKATAELLVQEHGC